MVNQLMIEESKLRIEQFFPELLFALILEEEDSAQTESQDRGHHHERLRDVAKDYTTQRGKIKN